VCVHKRNLVEINYNIVRLGRQVERTEKVAAKGHISDAEVDTLRDELEYWKNRKEVTLESQKSDERLQKAQMTQLRSAAVRLQRNLDVARRTMESLLVRAPKAGKLTAFNVEIGQSLGRGERVGQIDDPGAFKLVALIDEFYVNRVDIGQTATTKINGAEYAIESKKIYPQIRDGQFEVDFVFTDEASEGIRRGQTVQAKLALGATTTSLLIPNGAFFQDTGGNWVFVVGSDGNSAIKRSVRLGRRNIRYIEVLEGLDEGERIITSPYTNFIDSERLELGSGTTL
ncbi:MAG: efflux RND transporter periplasmic adaptor subunit, partial [Myxococcota bacterium]